MDSSNNQQPVDEDLVKAGMMVSLLCDNTIV